MRWTLLAVVVCAVSAAGLATAHESTTTHARVTLEVDDRGNCPGGRAMCFSTTGGSFANLHPGAEVEITFRNTGRAAHEVLVDGLTDRTREHAATEAAGFFAGSERSMAPGDEDTFTLLVPGGWTGLYLWCGVAGHEESGLWMEVPFEAAQTPLGSWAVVSALALAALVARGALSRQ